MSINIMFTLFIITIGYHIRGVKYITHILIILTYYNHYIYNYKNYFRLLLNNYFKLFFIIV